MTTSHIKNELDITRHKQIKQVKRLLDLMGTIRSIGELAKGATTDLIKLHSQLSQKIQEAEEIIGKMEEVI